MTLRDLYILHAPTLAEPPLGEAVIERELRAQSARRREVAKLALREMPMRGIGAELGIAGGTVRSTLRETMDSIRKHALGLPRYHNVGRPKGRGYGKSKKASAE